ncbi:MAG: phospholipid scramblase-related protein [Aquihabitans sp.]
MSDSGTHTPNWYPDPMGRHEYRWFDGAQWTDQVSSHGKTSIDPVQAPAHMPASDVSQERIAKGLAKAGVQVGASQGGGTLFTEPVLVVNQKAKLIEVSSEYAISDQNGNQIGAVREIGQSAAKKAIRVLTSFDQFLTHKYQVVDASGQVVLQLTRPAKMVKSKVLVQDGQGAEVGAILQENMIGKIHFGLVAGGQPVGSINAENWRAWNFAITDHTGAEVARITKTFAGLTRAMFTAADNYVVQIHRPLEGPLQALVVAAAVSVDTALKQDARGFN